MDTAAETAIPERSCKSTNWTPLPDQRDAVDEAGYGLGENPLIVHESGLITLCRLCHEAMTERRTRQALLKHPSLRHVGDPAKKFDNIFEFWALNERQVPFLACKDSWNPNFAQHFRVEKIEITKWPYGKAWGRYVRDGAEGEYQQIPNARAYTWRSPRPPSNQG